jgi:hypothetical protein
MFRDRFAATVVMGLAVLTAACSMPFRTPTLVSRPPDNTAFPGVAQLVAQAPDQTIDVVLVHGMCTQDAAWVNKTLQWLSVGLGGPATPAIDQDGVPDSKAELYRARLDTPHGTVRATAILWSPITVDLKRGLCYDQSQKSPSCNALGQVVPAYPYPRAPFNRTLKDGMLNDCLADAMIYQGKSRDVINAQMQRAVVAAVTQREGPSSTATQLRAAVEDPTPVVFITESLGSKVTFDAIRALTQSKTDAISDAGDATVKRFAQIFMAANQIPILGLADQMIDDGGRGSATPSFMDGRDVDSAEDGYVADPLAALLASRESGVRSLTGVSGEPAPLKVVAFTDPNDILTYALVGGPQDPENHVLVDVVVSNAPTVLGLAACPDTAHTGYLGNPAVQRLIVCGTDGCP